MSALDLHHPCPELNGANCIELHLLSCKITLTKYRIVRKEWCSGKDLGAQTKDCTCLPNELWGSAAVVTSISARWTALASLCWSAASNASPWHQCLGLQKGMDCSRSHRLCGAECTSNPASWLRWPLKSCWFFCVRRTDVTYLLRLLPTLYCIAQ